MSSTTGNPPTDSQRTYSIPELLEMMETVLNRGCSAISDEVNDIMRKASRTDGGEDACRRLLRIRFGDYAANAPRLLTRLINRVTTGLFFLLGLFVLSAFMAWKLWYTEPERQTLPTKLEKAINKLEKAINALRVPYRLKIQKTENQVEGETSTDKYFSQVLDRTDEPIQGVDVIYQFNDISGGTTIVNADSTGKFTLKTNDEGVTQAPKVKVGAENGSFKLVATLRGSTDPALTDSVTLKIGPKPVSPAPVDKKAEGEPAAKKAEVESTAKNVDPQAAKKTSAQDPAPTVKATKDAGKTETAKPK